MFRSDWSYAENLVLFRLNSNAAKWRVIISSFDFFRRHALIETVAVGSVGDDDDDDDDDDADSINNNNNN